MAAIEILELTRTYPGAAAPAVSRLSLSIGDGELVVVVGPSGCGKSTALRMVAGLDAPTSGAIRVGGRDVTRVPPQDRDVAMVFQGYALYPHMTARENMAFPLKMRGVPPKEREARVERAASMLGLGKLLGRRPGELSGGERQRVAMGRALVREPKAFLFDEPLSNLDAALRNELRAELASLVRRLGTTSLYVTHDQVEAMTMADRIAVMRGGELEHFGTPRAVYEEPATLFVARFLGTPAINTFDLELSDGMLRGGGVSLPLPPGEELPGRLVGAVRPEHVELLGEGAAEGVPLEVSLAEPLGAETILHLRGEGLFLRAKAKGFSPFRRGDAARARLPPEHVLLFDAESGRRIGRAGGRA